MGVAGSRLTKADTNKAIAMMASGKTQEQTADTIDISRSSVARISRNYSEQIRAFGLNLALKSIQDIQDTFHYTLHAASIILSGVHEPTEESLQLVKNAKKHGLSTSQLLNLANSKEQRITDIVGISARSDQPTVVNNILTQHNTNYIEPVVQQFFDEHADSLLEDPDVIEITSD